MARRQSKSKAEDKSEAKDGRERVTLRHSIFSYEDADGIPRRARRGAVIDVNEYDLERGKKGGAFVEHSDVPTPDLQGPEYGTAAAEMPIAGATAEDALGDFGDDQLGVWVAEQAPEDIAEAVVTARDAQRVIQAENRTTNNDPRTSLVSLMEAVIASTEAATGNTPEDEEPEDLTSQTDPGSDQE
jgi:hypothetical protein